MALLGIYFWEEGFRERTLFVGREQVKHGFLVALFILLIASDGVIEVVSRWRVAQARKGSA